MIRKYPYHGKYEREYIFVPYLYSIAQEVDETFGNTEENGWCAWRLNAPILLPNDSEGTIFNDREKEFVAALAGAIVYEDDMGFVWTSYFNSPEQFDKAWEFAKTLIDENMEKYSC